MDTLTCTEACDISRDETAKLLPKDKIDNTGRRKSNMSEIVERTNTPKFQGQNKNDRCENTSQTIDLHRKKGCGDERGTEDSDREDNYFIETDKRTQTTKVVLGSLARRKRKKRKEKP